MSGQNPPPMTDQDLQDWAGAVDAKSGVSGSGGATPWSVIEAGQAVTDLINARRGKS